MISMDFCCQDRFRPTINRETKYGIVIGKCVLPHVENNTIKTIY